ncbi:MAG: hypothetical protein HQM08_11620 [Candidatus Riflebacteria bacterium]|nr:hypothetical protein [Candidatus Riflebacteria bacterium]
MVKRTWRLCWLLVTFFSVLSCISFALDPKYERNGEVYVLVGDGAKRGVYRINNPSGEGGVIVDASNPIFNPGSSYGISVNLDRHVFTFTETVDSGFSLLSGNISVKMKTPGATVLSGHHYDHRDHWGEFGWPMYTTSGSYGTSWAGPTNPAFPVIFVTPDAAGYGLVPNGQWYQSADNDRSGRPGKTYCDNVEGKAHNYNLLEWFSGIAGNTPQNNGQRAKSYEKHVNRYMLGSCIDPCGTDQTEMTINSDPQYVSLSISSLGRVYCYTRTQSSTTDGKITRDNSPYSGPVIPASVMNDVSTQWVGCSLMNSSADYVYSLGASTIIGWLRAQGATVPPGFNVTAVTVSDQWNLKGGIVYSYNSANGMVYQFTREEKTDGTEGSTSYFRGINLGSDINDIKADGFGNLFYGKTAKFPADATGFSPANAFNVQWTSVSTDINRATGRVRFNQSITKSVYRLGLGATSESLVGGVNLGYDTWEQYFWVPITLSDGKNYTNITSSNYSAYSSSVDWHWLDSLPKKDPNPSVALPTRTQVGVVNVAAPPKVYGLAGSKGNLDIIGPLVNNAWVTDQTPQGLYQYTVENNPLWERDDWNKRYYDPSNPTNIIDTNGNGFLGGFVSTVAKSGADPNRERSDFVLYQWQIYQLQDAYGNVQTPAKLVKNSGSTLGTPEFTTTPNITNYFKAGVYQILCQAKFRWYNYNALPFGSTIADKPSCLTPGTGLYLAALPAPTPGAVTPSNPDFTGMVPIPSDAVCQILKVNLQTNPNPGANLTDIVQKMATDTAGPFHDPLVAGVKKYHVLDEKVQYVWKLKDETKLFTLPTITDSNKVSGPTWLGPANYTWSLNLNLPGNHPYPANLPSWSTADVNSTSVQFSLGIPTEPVFGTIQCTAYRDCEYIVNTYDSDGNPQGAAPVDLRIVYTGSVDVLVHDKTPPQVVSVNGGNLPNFNQAALLRGLTGEKITDSSLSNPSTIEMVVRDNNPFGNLITPCDVPGVSAHSPNLTMATLRYERKSNKELMPVASLAALIHGTTTAPFIKGQIAAGNSYGSYTPRQMRQMLMYSCPGLSDLPDDSNDSWCSIKRTRLSVPPGSLYSDVKYTFGVASMADFSDNPLSSNDVNSCDRIPINFANSSNGYDSAGTLLGNHEGYGMIFDVRDASGIPISAPVYVGRIDVRDNKKPSLWLEIYDGKSEKSEYIPFDVNNPSSLASIPGGGNLALQAPDYNLLKDTQDWVPAANGLFPSTCFTAISGNFAGMPIPPLTDFSALDAGAGKHPFELEDGVEVFFTLHYSDNIGVATNTTDSTQQNRPATPPKFRITGPDSGSMHYKTGATDINVPPTNVNTYRMIFRDAGVYTISAQVEDTARGFSNPLAADAASSHNIRTLKFGLVVVPTTLDVRVIDKSLQRK